MMEAEGCGRREGSGQRVGVTHEFVHVPDAVTGVVTMYEEQGFVVTPPTGFVVS